jgi:hypothetical protein
MYDAEYGEEPPKKKTLTQRMNERVNEELDRMERQKYLKKKRKLDDIKRLEEE